MTVNVRIFGYRGLQQLNEFLPKTENAIRPLRLNEPYEWSQVVAAPTGTSVFSSVVNPDQSTMLKIEIPDGQVIQYDINQPVGPNSPFMSGIQVIQWNQGWRLSLVQAFTVVGLTDDFGPIPGALLTDGSGVILTP